MSESNSEGEVYSTSEQVPVSSAAAASFFPDFVLFGRSAVNASANGFADRTSRRRARERVENLI